MQFKVVYYQTFLIYIYRNPRLPLNPSWELLLSNEFISYCLMKTDVVIFFDLRQFSQHCLGLEFNISLSLSVYLSLTLSVYALTYLIYAFLDNINTVINTVINTSRTKHLCLRG